MMFEHYSKHRGILFIISGILLFSGIVYFLIQNDRMSEPVACTMDAKICPDGSAVGRVPPNCEFAPCPTQEDMWGEVVRAIENCEVEAVFQAHSRDVSITYKDGRELQAVEPTIDDIIDIAVSAEPNCGAIIMATE
jgi:hypothetical protein